MKIIISAIIGFVGGIASAMGILSLTTKSLEDFGVKYTSTTQVIETLCDIIPKLQAQLDNTQDKNRIQGKIDALTAVLKSLRSTNTTSITDLIK